MVSALNIDNTFPEAQFCVKGFSSYRDYRTSQGGGILLYIREDITSNKIKQSFQICGSLHREKIISANLKFVSNALHSLRARVMTILLGDFSV